jgi:hypothetical protein
MTLEQLLQQKIDELEPWEPIDDEELEEVDPVSLTPIERDSQPSDEASRAQDHAAAS